MLPSEVYLPGDRELEDSAPSAVMSFITGDEGRGLNLPLVIENTVGHK